MATDMFGNILTPEEEERLRRHAEAMGMLPPALRIQMTAPFGGGIGPQSYQGSFAIPPSVPDSLPLFSQNITPIPTEVTVDPTMAGMAGVTQDYGPFSPSLGALTSILDPTPPSSSLPSYFDGPVVNEDMERVLAEEAATKVDDFARIASQDPVASLGGWIRDVTKPVELPDIVEKKQPYTSPMPRLSPEEMVPQTGYTQASYRPGGGGPGNIDWQGNVFSVENKNPFNLGHINPYGLPSQEPLPITVPVLPGLGLGLTAGAVTAATAGEGVQPGEPYSGMGDPSDAFSTGHPGMMGATGYDLSGADIEPSVDVQSQVDTFAGMGAVPAMSDPTGGLAATDPSLQGITPHSQASVLGDVFSSGVGIIDEGPFVPNNPISVLDKVFSTTPVLNWDTIKDLPQTVIPAVLDTIMPTAGADTGTTPAVDTFKDIPAAPAKPAGPTRAELKAAAAAQRKADEEARKAAARRTELARQALKDSQAAAAKAQAASQAQAAQAQAQAQAYIDWASSRDRGVDARELAAAIEVMSGVDSFGSGGMRNTRGEVGMDETGYTDTSGYGVG